MKRERMIVSILLGWSHLILIGLALLVVGLFAGCSVDHGPQQEDASELPGPGGVRRTQEPAPVTADASLADTADTASDSKSPDASETKPADAQAADTGPPRVSPPKCGYVPQSGTAGYVPCCPPGDDCKVTINPALDYCDCAAAPPERGATRCQVSATNYPQPEPVKQPWPSACVKP